MCVCDPRKNNNVKEKKKLGLPKGRDAQRSGREMKQASTVCSSLHLPGRARCTVALGSELFPRGSGPRQAAPPLTSLCCIRETPRAPCINAVIQNRHVKSQFLAAARARRAQRAGHRLFKAARMQVR